MNKHHFVATIAIAGVNLAATVLADINWSIVDSEWIAVKTGTNFYNDVLGDQSPASTDLIGTADSYSAGYWAFVEDGDVTAEGAADAFMFRMRVGGNGGNYVWQAHLNTDANTNDVEFIFEVVQSGSPSDQSVQLIATESVGPTLADITVANKALPAWEGGLGAYSRWTQVSDSTDYYVDFAIPWTIFTNITDVTRLEDIQAVLSTSSTHAGINKDAPLGGDLSQQISSALSSNIPEPTAITLIVAIGGGILVARRLFKVGY